MVYEGNREREEGKKERERVGECTHEFLRQKLV